MSIPIVYKGNTYQSRLSFSEEFGIPLHYIKSKMKEGISIEEIVKNSINAKPKKIPVLLEGRQYESIAKACKFYGFTRSMIARRIHIANWSLEEAFELKPRSTMRLGKVKGSIYIIRNFINEKVYVGSTIRDVEDRFEEHLYCADKPKYTTKLYKAIRALGAEEFYTITLVTTKDITKLGELEKSYIKKYNSIENVYNTSKGGEGICGLQGQIVTYKGTTYQSLSKLAAHLGITIHTLSRRLKRGLPPDQKIKSGPKPKTNLILH